MRRATVVVSIRQISLLATIVSASSWSCRCPDSRTAPPPVNTGPGRNKRYDGNVRVQRIVTIGSTTRRPPEPCCTQDLDLSRHRLDVHLMNRRIGGATDPNPACGRAARPG